MAQTGLAVLAGDQIMQTIQKVAGTVVGLVWGVIIWYVGSGHGKGNRIGLGAAFFVCMLPAMALRLHAPPQHAQSAIIGSVTVVLIVSYKFAV
jgi:hypothetical protein